MKRVDGELAVSRALGDFQFKDIELDAKLTKVGERARGSRVYMWIFACVFVLKF